MARGLGGYIGAPQVQGVQSRQARDRCKPIVVDRRERKVEVGEPGQVGNRSEIIDAGLTHSSSRSSCVMVRKFVSPTPLTWVPESTRVFSLVKSLREVSPGSVMRGSWTPKDHKPVNLATFARSASVTFASSGKSRRSSCVKCVKYFRVLPWIGSGERSVRDEIRHAHGAGRARY